MADVDAILASGRYTDRRGRRWHLCMRRSPLCGMWHQGHPSRGVTRAEMRTLIVRERHRSACPGLRDCQDHPVPYVWIGASGRSYSEPARGYNDGTGHNTHAAAITAARHRTGETP